MRQGGDAGAVGVDCQQPFHGGADVVARCKMGGPDHSVGERAKEQDPSFALEQSLNLSLPLFRTKKAVRCQQCEDFAELRKWVELANIDERDVVNAALPLMKGHHDT